MFIDKKIIPVPYDFDMAGFVNCSYAVVSQVSKSNMGIESVTERLYRGFKRDNNIFNQVRQEFIDNKTKIFAALDEYEVLFDNPNEFKVARNYIESFFIIIGNDKKFGQEIINHARTK